MARAVIGFLRTVDPAFVAEVEARAAKLGVDDLLLAIGFHTLIREPMSDAERAKTLRALGEIEDRHVATLGHSPDQKRRGAAMPTRVS